MCNITWGFRHVRENPTFGPVFLPPMVLDPIDFEAADDFDEGSDQLSSGILNADLSP